MIIAVYNAKGKYQKVDFSHIEEGKAEYEKVDDNGWVAMVQHHFASAWLVGDKLNRADLRCGDDMVVLFQRPHAVEKDALKQEGATHQAFVVSGEEPRTEGLYPRPPCGACARNP